MIFSDRGETSCPSKNLRCIETILREDPDGFRHSAGGESQPRWRCADAEFHGATRRSSFIERGGVRGASRLQGAEKCVGTDAEGWRLVLSATGAGSAEPTLCGAPSANISTHP